MIFCNFWCLCGFPVFVSMYMIARNHSAILWWSDIFRDTGFKGYIWFLFKFTFLRKESFEYITKSYFFWYDFQTTAIGMLYFDSK